MSANSVLLVENGHVAELPEVTRPEDLGAAVRRAWAASNELAPVPPDQALSGRSLVAATLGFANDDSMLTSGATCLMVHAIDGLVDFVSTQNTGAGGGFDGLPEVTQIPAEELDDLRLGQLVLDVMKESR